MFLLDSYSPNVLFFVELVKKIFTILVRFFFIALYSYVLMLCAMQTVVVVLVQIAGVGIVTASKDLSNINARISLCFTTKESFLHSPPHTFLALIAVLEHVFQLKHRQTRKAIIPASIMFGPRPCCCMFQLEHMF